MSSPYSELATSGADYTFTSGTLEFADGEVTRSFSLFISDDTLPEVSEYVFIAITSVELDEGSVDTVDTSGTLKVMCYNIFISSITCCVERLILKPTQMQPTGPLCPILLICYTF